MDKNPSMLRATLIGGAVFGVAGGIPIISALNCLCCALVIGGGFLAAFLYSKECANENVAFTPGNGALVGLVAGLFYALASSIVSGFFSMLMGPPDIDAVLDMFEGTDLPPESVDMITGFMERSAGIMGIIFGFFFALLLAAVFSTIGGLIGGAVFKVEPTAPAPPAPPMGGSSGSMGPSGDSGRSIGSPMNPPDSGA